MIWFYQNCSYILIDNYAFWHNRIVLFHLMWICFISVLMMSHIFFDSSLYGIICSLLLLSLRCALFSLFKISNIFFDFGLYNVDFLLLSSGCPLFSSISIFITSFILFYFCLWVMDYSLSLKFRIFSMISVIITSIFIPVFMTSIIFFGLYLC